MCAGNNALGSMRLGSGMTENAVLWAGAGATTVSGLGTAVLLVTFTDFPKWAVTIIGLTASTVCGAAVRAFLLHERHRPPS